ncbi:related to fatty acid synthase, beta and alpha chains [Sporisorium reilianum SRZ2]|uniref:Related to fatty acid synthase, beta and alpha chains n=1 Tax=Sporisorium reilianum (strain SRZ2) TaxID=999809 RepID=E7A1L4_SPORE|nr:related to fatty acid synthase, beta and alpha chains [Sporisorium reilianum SRZ2]
MSGIKNAPSDDSYVELSTTSSQSSGNGNGTLLRALTVASTTGVEVQIPVPSQPFDAWIVADVLREEFQRSLAASPEANDVLEVQDEQDQAGAADKAVSEAKVSLAAKFLGFVASRVSLKPASSSHELNLLQHAWTHFHDEFLAQHGSVHDLVAAIDSDLRTPVLRSYFEAFVLLESTDKAKPSLVTPKLFSLSAQNKAEVHAVFGGQGNNEAYFKELQTLFDAYRPLVQPLLESTQPVFDKLVEDAVKQGFASYYTHGFNVLGWLTGAAAEPAVSYLASVPLSLPLIGLTQITQFLVSIRASGLTPAEFRSQIKSATGHSQGIISAVVLSASDSLASFNANVAKALELLFHIGKRGQEFFPTLAIDPALVKDTVEGGEGEPTPMLSVSGLEQAILEKHIQKTNSHLAESQAVSISLFNGPRSFIVTGFPKALVGLVGSLRAIRADTGADQGKTPFSKRKAVFRMNFLPVGVPYHSAYLTGATEKMLQEDYAGRTTVWDASELKVAVKNTEDGSDLASYRSEDILKSIADQIFVKHIYWSKASDLPKSATHLIDFGTGGLSGIGGLSARILEGRGVRIVIPSGTHARSSELYSAATVKFEERWEDVWSPRLVKTKNGIKIDTPFSRTTGRGILMVGGMTPTTVSANINAAVLNAGYLIELAGGGLHSEAGLRKRVNEILAQLEPGNGLELNGLFIDQRRFGWQYPLWGQMRREGFPCKGFTVAAGIPSTEKAKEIIDGLKAAGIEYVGFKPGTADGLRAVAAIAAANPDFKIICQWTGGRAGGHHSTEDFHQPLLQTYASLRKQKNLILVGGSGFGDAEGVWPYLTGEWSVKLGYAPMPFSAFLFASWMLVAKEAATADAVKQLLVDTPGCGDDKWQDTYGKGAGGTITCNSELGESISYVHNRAAALWRQLDDQLFSLPREKQRVWLSEKKSWLIERLNKDFQKPWFAAKLDGTTLMNVADMTYEEVTRRMLELLFVGHQSRWIDPSLKKLFGDWCRRVEERFAGIETAGKKESLLQSYSILDKEPSKFVDGFFAEYTGAKEIRLAAEDVGYFLTICQRRGQKPVPFIPELGDNFQTLFKKDSLWQSEDLDAVVGQDAQKVIILQGSVAVQHCTKANVPAGEMLGEIEKELVAKVLAKYYDNDESKVPVADYVSSDALALDEADFCARSGVDVSVDGDVKTFKLGSQVPDTKEWLELLATQRTSWLRALLRNVSVVQGKNYADNPMLRMLAPRKHQTAKIAYAANGEPLSLTLFGAARSHGRHDDAFKALEITKSLDSAQILVTLFEERLGESVPLHFHFTYRPDQPFASIHEIMDGRNDRIKQFYWQLWFHADMPAAAQLAAAKEFKSPVKSLDEAAIRNFCRIVENRGEVFTKGQAPMDFAIVAGWEAIMQALMASCDADLLSLVHLSNSFKVIDDARPLRAGDVCTATAHASSIKISDTGKSVSVTGTVLRKDASGELVPVISVVSSFFFRGRFTDFNTCFETSQNEFTLEIKTKADATVLLAKEWFDWVAPQPLAPGTVLHFKIQSLLRYKDSTSYSDVDVSGGAYVRDYKDDLIKVGEIEYTADALSYGNPVIEYIKRNGGASTGGVAPLETGYTIGASDVSTSFVAPATNEPYSNVSGDFNPIHINPYFSSFASLPGTITHGLFSSAASRKFVEVVAAEGYPDRCLSFEANFVGMVLPGDELTVKLRHIAMRDGNKVIKVETFNQNGDKVIDGQAEVKQPATVYVFTGQGSQEQGMGMDLYNSSPTAKALWDEADGHLRSTMGFSILEIINQNPLTKTIHFGGVRGHTIRERYMSMTYESTDADGNTVTLPLFPEISSSSQSYTFQSPKGLLFATQFAQIALVLVELSAFRDMKQRGLITPDAAFAGHSLGEYASLAAVASVLEVKSLCDVVFYRGLSMQNCVQRDPVTGASNYAMMACNPLRIVGEGNPAFAGQALAEIVDSISKESGRLLQIVNHNVAGQQYVTAGDLVALATLGNVLNFIKIQKIDLKKLNEIMPIEEVREKLAEIVREVLSAALEEEKKGRIELKRGFATIPLPGIDVPFHSRYLTGGVAPFRSYLSKRINVDAIRPQLLVGRYIPNLVAAPFELSKPYAELIFAQTDSPRLDKVLKNWEKDEWESPEKVQRLTATLVVELLAYQFASPVRWIETQDIFFTDYNFERLVEFGPSPTLVGMAKRTQALKYSAVDLAQGRKRVMYCSSKDKESLYYAFADDESEVEAAPAAEAPAAAAPVAAAPVAAAPAPAAAGGAAAAEVPDEPLKAVDTVRAILAQKLKKNISEVPLSKSIKDSVGGKSVLSNELVSDVLAEFGNLPERGEELPLEELGGALQAGYSGTLGKTTSNLITRTVGGKLPGGFNLSAVKSHLQKAWGLGAGRTDGALLVAVTMEPAKRLGSEAEAKAWLDSVAQTYASLAGISLSQASAGGGGGGSGGVAISSEELDRLKAQQDEHVRRQIQVLERYLNMDGRASGRLAESTKAELEVAQAQLDAIAAEHGDLYTNGIMPKFSEKKVRHFSSYWNWARQDAMTLLYDIIYGRLTTVDREITARCITLMNRADPSLLRYMQFHIDQIDAAQGPTYALAKEYGQQLIENCREACAEDAVYKEVHAPTAPHTEIDARGNIAYSEVKRVGVRKLEAYVKEMAAGSRLLGAGSQVNLDKAQENVAKLWTLIRNEPSVSKLSKATIKSLYSEVVRSLGPARQARAPARQAPRNRRLSSNTQRPQVSDAPAAEDRTPFLHVKRKVAGQWQLSRKLTSVYLDILGEMATQGVSFKGRNALLTGVGKASIGVEVVKGLLAGGARVVITTSSYSRSVVEYYQRIYQEVGSRGSTLTVVPFNQASKQDVDNLVKYIYGSLDLDLDFVVPFAAISENGREIDGIDDKSELAHRLMLTNLVRLLGAIKTEKASRNFDTRPTQVLLPLSPNHGTFGGDGLYGESKLGLETLLNRWESESWGQYLCITGAIIGWCRGTGLMSSSNTVAEEIEKLGCRTFSTTEMAFNLLGLLAPTVSAVSQVEALLVDLNGGMDKIVDLAEQTAKFRAAIQEASSTKRALVADNSADFKVIKGSAAEALHKKVHITPRSNFTFRFPEVGSHQLNREIAKSYSAMDLEKVVVITGFAEVGPWGSSRTRWGMEAFGHLTNEGVIELAWIMGLIKHHDGQLKSGATYVGWIDVKSGEPVDDKDIRANYEEHIIKHAGIRLIEPELFRNYDPNRKGFQQEIELNHDLEPLEVSAEEASKYKLEHGDKVDAWQDASTGGWFVVLKKGARIFVPKAVAFDRLVAGQLPTGWSGQRYGIPDDIVAQVDRTTLWALVCASEALVNSGISDPYELYKHIHPSKVGSCIGSGMGGMTSLSKMFRDRRNDTDVQNDILQETFINSVAGWVNLLVMSSAGPIKTVVGACATALQSIDVAVETILSGKAELMLAGGFDDLSEEGSFEFANMKATSNGKEELAAGREPSEHSRPFSTSRSGFMESQGCGVQVLTTAANAIRLGMPIQGIVAYSNTHTDGAGRSLPAPGHGVISSADGMQRALARFNLTADDIGVISAHMTATKANDKNESHVYQELFTRMGRTPGHAVPVMAQKWLCGHAKGGAAAWALNGVMQSLHTSIVCGNRNADDISPELQKFDMLLYNSTSIHRTPHHVNAAAVSSFGFGQVGGIILVLHAAHILGRLSPQVFDEYVARRKARQHQTYTRMHSALTKQDLVRIKDNRPWPAELEDQVLMNLNARAVEIGDSYGFKAPLPAMPALATVEDTVVPAKPASVAAQQESLEKMMGHVAGVGIDCEKISTFPSDNENFISRNFTDVEIEYCRAQPDVRASFCGRFCAAEAVVKSLGVRTQGAGASLKDVEIVPTPEGPQVKLYGEALKAANGSRFLVSISHGDDTAMAIVHRLPSA